MASLLRLRQFAESRGVKYLSDQLPIPQAFHKNSERLRVDPGTIAELNWVMPIAISLRNQGYDLAIYRRDTEE